MSGHSRQTAARQEGQSMQSPTVSAKAPEVGAGVAESLWVKARHLWARHW